MTDTTPHQTRAQRVFAQAIRDVQETAAGDKALTEEAQKIYGGLCHRLPVLVRQNGLCQTLAYIEAKATGKDGVDRVEAYRRIRHHIATVLRIIDDRAVPDGQLLNKVASGSLAEYRLWTMFVLSAWVYYKRFAISILGVEGPEATEEDE